MIDKQGKKVKTIMKDFTINEISAVDRPAQAHARMAILKRADPEYDVEAMAKLDGFSVAMTTPTAGHAHLIVLGSGEIVRRAGQTDFTDGHSHPWLMDEGGQIVIGHAEGHNHGLDVISKNNPPDGDTLAADGEKPPASNDQAAEAIGTLEDQDMTQKSTTAADEVQAAKQHEEDIAKLTKRAERAELVADLSDAHRAYFKSLQGNVSDEFLRLDADARDAAVKAVHDANKVVYKAEDGAEYRKNDDPRLIELAKAMDAERKKRLLSEEKAKKADLEKRAAELTHIPDKDNARIALLKAIDSLPEEEQVAAMAALKAQNTRMSSAFKTAGTSVAPNSDNSEVDELDAMAKRIAERDSITFEQGYAKALQTSEGIELYTKTVEAQMS